MSAARPCKHGCLTDSHDRGCPPRQEDCVETAHTQSTRST